MRLKPFNGPFECIEGGTTEINLASQPPPKVAGGALIGDDSLQNSQLIVHCCNTWPAIAGQTLLEMWSSLVIRIAGDQD
jgi:hypothetical protein